MTKILNNAIIAKCSECERYCFPTHIEGIWSDTCLHRDFPRPIKPVNPDSIDPSCPLREVEIMTHPAQILAKSMLDDNYIDSIACIVIVKRGDR